MDRLAGLEDPGRPVLVRRGQHNRRPRGHVGRRPDVLKQSFQVGGAVTDRATVIVRYHNVIVTVTLDGLEHSNRGTYGPVSKSQLSAAALAFAQAAAAALR